MQEKLENYISFDIDFYSNQKVYPKTCNKYATPLSIMLGTFLSPHGFITNPICQNYLEYQFSRKNHPKVTFAGDLANLSSIFRIQNVAKVYLKSHLYH